MKCYFLVTIMASWFSMAFPAEAQPAPATGQPPATTTPAHDSKRIGTFKQVQGPAWLGQTDAHRAAAPGERVQEGERISTGKNGTAMFTLKDGTVMTLGPESSLHLNQFQFDTTTQQGHLGLELLQGSLRVVTGLLAKINPERFRITTPTAVVGVRGTDFIVDTTAQ